MPIPTQIGPKVLSQARSLCEGTPTDAKYTVLKEGTPYDGSVSKQVSKFDIFFKYSFYYQICIIGSTTASKLSAYVMVAVLEKHLCCNCSSLRV